jgi:transposase-like protein
MGKPNFNDEFKRDAVAQIIERGLLTVLTKKYE